MTDSGATATDRTNVVLYGGKGGVGKTTCAAAHALSLARSDAETLVVSTDPAHSLGDAAECELGAEPREVESSLFAVEIDPERGQAAYRSVVEALAAEFREAGLRLDDADLERLFEAGLIPGGDEVAALEYAARHAERLETVESTFDRPVRRVPEFDGEVGGLDALGAVGARLV